MSALYVVKLFIVLFKYQSERVWKSVFVIVLVRFGWTGAYTCSLILSLFSFIGLFVVRISARSFKLV